MPQSNQEPLDTHQLLALRREIDAKHQPSHANHLHALFETLGEAHPTPYVLPYGERIRVVNVCPVGDQPRWQAEGIVGPFVYRICGWQSLLQGAGWRDRWQVTNPDASFTSFLRQVTVGTRRWFALANYADGPLRGLGNVTWWTPAALVESVGVAAAAHENGMPDDWLSTESVVLRCRVAAIKRASFVPSVLDAFFSEVFLATREVDRPKHGVAIALDRQAVRAGAAEIVCGDLDVGAIEFFPALIGASDKPVVLDDSLRGMIAAYLRTTQQ